MNRENSSPITGKVASTIRPPKKRLVTPLLPYRTINNIHYLVKQSHKRHTFLSI